MIPYKKTNLTKSKIVPCPTCEGSNIDPEKPESKCPDCVDGTITITPQTK